MAEATNTKEQPAGMGPSSLGVNRRYSSSDSLESFTSDMTQSVAGEAPDTMSTFSALYSTGSKRVTTFPLAVFPLSASTMDLSVNGKKQPKKGLRGLANRIRRKHSSELSSDLQGETTATSTADAATMSASDLSDTFRLRMGTVRGRLHLKDSHAIDRK